MDKSVDSIGSCSLDVDADFSDVSDTSGSLNFPTPLSSKDITREFTSKIRERCQVSQNTTALLDPVPVLSPNDVVPGKKPSYLNLACCVNGYSNLTTYDSKIRQDLNKSREVSPIRPSATSIQFCKRNNLLAPPILVTSNNFAPKVKPTMAASPQSAANVTSYKYASNENGNGSVSYSKDLANEHFSNASSVSNEQFEEIKTQSFIQQRVERLYGPGALAQGFYSPKKMKSRYSGNLNLSERSENGLSEYSRKFQQLSPSKDYNEFSKRVNATNLGGTAGTRQLSNDISFNNSIDLPVLRHLSQEFRAQLPSISPKRNYTKNSPGSDAAHFISNNGSVTDIDKKDLESQITTETIKDEVDHKVNVSNTVNIDPSDRILTTENIITKLLENSDHDRLTLSNTIDTVPQIGNPQLLEQDGNYFLGILKYEQSRLLSLASEAEKYINSLSNNKEISEEILGILRSASGKARLLVSQKMKQFEGLCHNNLNRSPEDKFPTTIGDLQGFWDMVHLQVDQIDLIFQEIEIMKENDWKKSNKITTVANVGKQSKPLKAGNTKSKALPTNTNNISSKSVPMSAAALRREAQRKVLMELKRKNKMAISTVEQPQSGSTNAIEIFINHNIS